MHSVVVVIFYGLSLVTNTVGYEDFVHAVHGYKQESGKAQARQKRGVIEKLLGQANLINKLGSYRQYSKLGGYEQALKDFETLKATAVTGSKAAQRGQVGDTSVIMNKIMRKNVGYTVLTFMKNQVLPGGKNELKIDTIRYFD